MSELGNGGSLNCMCTCRRGTLRFDQYRAICREHNTTDPAALNSLAFFLRSLGIAINYRDDQRLIQLTRVGGLDQCRTVTRKQHTNIKKVKWTRCSNS